MYSYQICITYLALEILVNYHYKNQENMWAKAEITGFAVYHVINILIFFFEYYYSRMTILEKNHELVLQHLGEKMKILQKKKKKKWEHSAPG